MEIDLKKDKNLIVGMFLGIIESEFSKSNLTKKEQIDLFILMNEAINKKIGMLDVEVKDEK